MDVQDYRLERFAKKNPRERESRKRSDSRNDKREKVALAKLTLRRSIGAGAKSFEVANKTSTEAIARAFPAGVKRFLEDP